MSITYTAFEIGILKAPFPYRITSLFGKRHDPNDRSKVKPHNGIDIGIPVGTPIVAPVNCVVEWFRVDKNGYGLYLVLKAKATDFSFDQNGADDYYLVFAHLSSYQSGLFSGKEIKVGEVVAYTGGDPKDKPNAGASTGPHLHFEVRIGRNSPSHAVNPLYYWLSYYDLIYDKTNSPIPIEPRLIFSSDQTLSQNDYTTVEASGGDFTVKNKTEYKRPAPKRVNDVNQRLALGIWQIVKLIFDSSVEKRQVADSSISVQTGSLLNFFRKVCQPPLVEFFGDTYGNQYYFVVRKPPFDRESIMRMMSLTMLSIEPEDVVATSLEWNDANVFSWYKILPYMEVQGTNEATNILYPAIFFPEYASIWGSRPLCLESNYYDYRFSGRFNKDKQQNAQNVNDISKNVIRDLKYLIESNAYLPFTRRGTITLIGDRRIKRGNWIKHTSGEIFYVDSVTNAYEVNSNGVSRLTTLNVSRGMYPELIEGIDNLKTKQVSGSKTLMKERKIGYFNLIDWGDDFDIEKVTFDNQSDVLNKWKVDVDVFGYFMSKRQVYYNQINRK